MKTKEEYDQHLLQFYAETFRAFALKNGLPGGRNQTNEAEEFANEALKQYGSAINNGIALELISNIKLNNTTISDCIDNYPTMFWKTAEGLKELRNLPIKQIRDTISILSEKIISKNPLEPNDIENALKNLIKDAKKIAFKDMNLSSSMINDFSLDLKNCLKYFGDDIQLKGKEEFIEKLKKDLSTIDTSLLKVYMEEVDKKENVEAFSYIHQFMHANIRELSKTIESNNSIRKIPERYLPMM